MDAEYPSGDNWFRERADAVAKAQFARLCKVSRRLPESVIIDAFRAMPADDAYLLITRDLLPDAVRRRMIEAHDRAVDGVAAAREGMGAGV
jgi:hypothetical protein